MFLPVLFYVLRKLFQMKLGYEVFPKTCLGRLFAVMSQFIDNADLLTIICNMETITPKKLKSGDTIRVIAPARTFNILGQDANEISD